MKKLFYPKKILSIIFIAFIFAQAIGQPCTENQNDCDPNPPTPWITTTFLDIDPLVLCGERVLVTINFTDISFPNVFPEFACPIEICLNENGSNNIQFAGMFSNNPFACYNSAAQPGSTTLTVDYNPTSCISAFPPLKFYVKANCNLWEEVVNSPNSNALLDNQIQLSTCASSGDIQCIKATSPPFDIIYSAIRLGDGNNVNGVPVKEPFDLEIPMEITGTNCEMDQQNSYEITVDFDQNIDLSGASISVALNNNLPVNFIPAQLTNPLIVTIHPNDFDPMDPFCSSYFSGGIGEAILMVKNLVVSDCPDPILEVNYSVDNCINPDQNCNPTGCISETTSYIFMDNGDPALSMEWEVIGDGMDFCVDDGIPTKVEYTITNNSNDFATDIRVDLAFSENVFLQSFGVGNSGPYNFTLNGFSTFNSDYGSCPVVTSNVINYSGISFDFSCHDLNTTTLGLSDPDCDLVFGDLNPGESFTIVAYIESLCPSINPDACGPPHIPPAPTISGAVRWNNECHSLADNQLMGAGLDDPGELFVIGGAPPEFIFECGDTPDVNNGEEIEINVCYPGWNFSGIEAPLYEHTPENMEQILTLTLSDNNLIFSNITMNGSVNGLSLISQTPAFPLPPNEIKIGVSSGVAVPTADRCFSIKFELDCPEQGAERTVDFSTELTGFWDECDPLNSCRIAFGKKEIEIYQLCSCFPGRGNSDWTCKCSELEVTSFSVKRPADSNQNSCGAYSCDYVKFSIKGEIEHNGAPGSNELNRIRGGFLYEQINGNNIFDINSAKFIIDGENFDVTQMVIPYEDEGDYGSGEAPTFRQEFWYELEEPFFYDDDFTVELKIKAQVREDAVLALNDFNPPEYVYPIRDFRGFLGVDLTHLSSDCIKAGEAQLFNLYNVNSAISAIGAIAECNNGLITEPGIALGYCGGSAGDEFPNEERPVNRYLKQLKIRLEDGNGFLIPDVGIEEIILDDHDGLAGPIINVENDLGLPPSQNEIIIPDITDYIDDLLDKDLFSNSRELRVTLNGKLECHVEEIFVNFQGTYEINTYSNDPFCLHEKDFDLTVPVIVVGGDVNTFPLNPQITTACTSSNDPSVVPLSVWAAAPGLAAEHALIYFDLTQFEEGDVLITPVVPSQFIDSDYSTGYQWFVFANAIPSNGMEYQFNYEINTCDPTIVNIPYVIYKQCLDPIDKPIIPFTNVDCSDIGNFEIEVLPSDIIMTVHQCNEPVDFCDPVKYSILIENPSKGPIHNLSFQMIAPENMELVNAWFRYADDFPLATAYDCEVAGYSEIVITQEELATTGWIPGIELYQTDPAGGLPGYKMPQDLDWSRQIHIILELETSCEDLIESDEVTFMAKAKNNCGDKLDPIIQDNTGHLEDDICANIDIELSCETLAFSNLSGNAFWNLKLNYDGPEYVPCNFDLNITAVEPFVIVSQGTPDFEFSDGFITINNIAVCEQVGQECLPTLCPPELNVEFVIWQCATSCDVVVAETTISNQFLTATESTCSENGTCITTTIANDGCIVMNSEVLGVNYYCDLFCSNQWLTPIEVEAASTMFPMTPPLPGEEITFTICDIDFAGCNGCIRVEPVLSLEVGGSRANCSLEMDSTICEIDTCLAPQNLYCEITPDNADLFWDAVPGAIQYVIHFNNFSEECGCEGLDMPGYIVHLPTGADPETVNVLGDLPSWVSGCFSWYVEAICYDGVPIGSGSRSDTICYSYADGGCAAPCPAPENLSCFQWHGANLSWGIVPEALSYEVLIDFGGCNCTGIGQVSYPVDQNSLNLQLAGLTNSCFSWSIRAFCADGGMSDYSDPGCYNPILGCFFVQAADPNGSGRNLSTSSNNNNLSVYPNPTRGNLTIKYDMPEALPLAFKVVNVEGKVVKVFEGLKSLSNNFQYTWEIEEQLPNGVYFLIVETEKEVFQEKFVLIR